MEISFVSCLFSLFSFFCIFSGVMVITSANVNPVQAVLWLIVSFVNASGILFLLEMEFMALLFIMVLVGAIAILFLFVVMMLNIKTTTGNRNWFLFFPVSFISVSVFSLISLSILSYKSSYYKSEFFSVNYFSSFDVVSVLNSLGQYLFTLGGLLFLISGIVLLVSMIGCIALTRDLWHL